MNAFQIYRLNTRVTEHGQLNHQIKHLWISLLGVLSNLNCVYEIMTLDDFCECIQNTSDSIAPQMSQDVFEMLKLSSAKGIDVHHMKFHSQVSKR